VAAKLPGFATSTNPIDVTAALLQNSGMFGDVLPILAKDASADLFFLHIPVAGAGYDVERFARDTAQFAATTGKPGRCCGVAGIHRGRVSRRGPRHVRERGRSTRRFCAGGVAHGVDTQAAPALAGRCAGAGTAGRAALFSTKPTASRCLPRPACLLCLTGCAGAQRKARAAFDALGGPVAVKACSVDVPHKSEHGLVSLGVASGDEAARLFVAQWTKLDALKASPDGVIVAAMRKGRRELMVGARVDPVFGPIVIVGDGGKYVEALKDFAILVPPFDADEVRKALRGLRIGPIVDGVRGEPPLDVDALAAIAIGVGRLIRAAKGGIASIDLNPVMVGAVGEGAVVVDALIERGGQGRTS
jgi:acyl-CoA synthetase (NDP forming)